MLMRDFRNGGKESSKNNQVSSENKIIIKNQHGVQNLGNILNFPVTGSQMVNIMQELVFFPKI